MCTTISGRSTVMVSGKSKGQNGEKMEVRGETTLCLAFLHFAGLVYPFFHTI